MANEEKEKRERDLVVVSQLTDALLVIMEAAELPEKNVSNSILVLSLFYRRFKDSTAAIRKLQDMRDSMLIARSMIEGMALLIWILEDIETRVKEYLDLYLIELQQRMQAQENMGRKIPHAHKEVLKKEIQKVSERILKGEEFNDLIIFDEPIKTEHFYKRLTGKSYSELFVNANAEHLHKTNYNVMSGYHHWNPLQLLTGMSYQSWDLSEYGSDSRSEYAMSLVAAYVCLSGASQNLLEALNKEKLLLEINSLQHRLFSEGIVESPSEAP